MSSPAAITAISYKEAFIVWARIALLSFGGPAGQIAVMHRILVEEKRWIGDRRFLHALNFCMLLPGPEATQLATYIGWLLHGVRGGVLAGVLFVLPGIVAIMALSMVYAIYGQTPWLTSLFWGLKAAVLAIVIQAVFRIGKRVLNARSSQIIALAAFIGIFFFDVAFPVIVLGAAIIGAVLHRYGLHAQAMGGGHSTHSAAAELPDCDSFLGEALPEHANKTTRQMIGTLSICLTLWLLPVFSLYFLLGEGHVFTQVSLFFSKLAVVSFGGAYAVLSYMAQAAVEQHHWLRPGEMLDGLSMAETTPGPLIMVTQFVGFMAAFREAEIFSPLLAGAMGGLLATWVTFVPCYLWIFLGAPYIEKLRHSMAVAASLGAITAAVVGVILNLALWFAVHTLFAETRAIESYGLSFALPVWRTFDAAFLAMLFAACGMVFVLRMPMLLVLLLCAIAGAGYAYI